MSPDLRHEENQPLTDPYLGRRLGGYVLVRRVGEGGMGAVYLARSEPGVQVAIKLVKRGMDTDAILRRFQNERRILAALDHPNIARLLDAGTTDEGLPYFVMEYIAGRPVHSYCDAEKLPVAARLELFQKVCAAVQCAHDLQVIHRDIKPENILVLDGGQPKLLDFGIAKILDRALIPVSEEVTVTLGAVMTPRYASPEQARGGVVTPASDIYSLGVLLYELLTGRSPYRLSERSAHALVDAICHQNPELPSAAIARNAAGEAPASAIGENRGTDPETLRHTLAGDLDGILLTALEKDPELRYPSTAEFSADIDRYREGARVRARRSRFRYAPFPGVGMALAALILIVALAAGALWYLRNRRPAVAVRPSVAVLGFENLSHQSSAEWLGTALTEMLSSELAAGGRLRTIPGELVSRVKFELVLPNAQTFTGDTLGRLRRSLSADYVVSGSYLAVDEGRTQTVRLDLRLQDTRTGEAITSVSETRGATELLQLVATTGAMLRRQLGAGELSRSESGTLQGSLPQGGDAARNYAEGLERLRRFDTLAARDLLRNAVTAAPGHALSHAALASASTQLGYDVEARDEAKKALDLSAGLSPEDRLVIEGGYWESTRAWDKAVATYEKLRHDFPDNLEYGLRLAAAQSEAGQGLAALQTVASLRALPAGANDPRVDLAETEAALSSSDLSRAASAARNAVRSGSAQGFRILAARARLLESRIFLQTGDPQKALAAAAESRRLYQAAGHRQGVAWALNEAGGVLTQLGDVAGARSRFEEALTVCRTIGDQSCIGTDLDSLGVLRRRQGDLQGAIDMHQQAIDIRRAVGDRSGVATSLYNVGNVLEVMGNLPNAREALSESLDLRRQLGENRSAALTLTRLANIRRRQGELAESLAMNNQAVAGLTTTGDRGGTAMARFNLGLTLLDQGDLAKSREAFEQALAVRREQEDKNNIAQVLAGLARVAVAQDRLDEARGLITESTTLRRELGEIISLAQSKLGLAYVDLAANRFEPAETSARQAAATFHGAHAVGWEAECLLAAARAQLGRGDLRASRESLDSVNRLLRNSPDRYLLLMRDVVAGRTEGSSAMLERALGEATRSGFLGAAFESRLALVQLGKAPAALLSTDARQAGFSWIARRASDVAQPPAR